MTRAGFIEKLTFELKDFERVSLRICRGKGFQDDVSVQMGEYIWYFGCKSNTNRMNVGLLLKDDGFEEMQS